MHRSFAPCDAAMNDTMRSNALADCNTIVDMSLRLSRFVLCVVAALLFAFGFALVTSNKKVLTHVYEDKLAGNETLSATASSVVENYNTLFGYVLFTGGKVFEVFCETLIFPTLATYLHNCSLYPGDQPARMHSFVKARCIFWGLKTVIILMNVGFTSVYVGQTTLDLETASRHLAVSDDFTMMSTHFKTPRAVEIDSILRTSLSGATIPFAFKDTCPGRDSEDVSMKKAWVDDVDTTFVSFSFPAPAWNAALLLSEGTTPTTSASISLQDYSVNGQKPINADDWDIPELYSCFKQGTDKLGLSIVQHSAVYPLSSDDLVHAIAGELKAALGDTMNVSDLIIHLEHREVAEDIHFTSLAISIPVEMNDRGSILCGHFDCVYAASSTMLNKLHLQSSISIASYEGDENTALVYGSTNQFLQEVHSAQTPHEVLILSMGKLSWQLSPLHIRHDAACADDGEQQCVGLSLPLGISEDILLIKKKALSTQHLANPFKLVTLHPARIQDAARSEKNVVTSWYRLLSPAGLILRPSAFECNSLVDAYLTHLKTNHLYLDESLSLDMYSAALLYLVQRGVPASLPDAISRRRLSEMALTEVGNFAAATADIEVNVPTATAMVTVAGSIFIVLLMLCVIFLPTSRVKLSPDTTPAAQYVQILTDDLYPDLVHKKRLRFSNGDCLLFNEYVVDTIGLHAKRDQSKKIYL
ncbi:hypothetical protein CCR75_008573 [Bremia lactucae]|uniref:Uncharacterized protein n=1 Tax=Bremia lactucae TaxID=4779 RepID=A0A976ID96_BRELC|nr:hypothetical protein CCR75_008573 [Bremia lactucae]